VQLAGADGFALSIPLEVAVRIDRDVLLASEMNGVPLPRDHGYPLRLFVPGFAGARSVKWIETIKITDDESTAPWHTRMYRLFGQNNNFLADVPEATNEEALRASPACLEGPINSMFLAPLAGDMVESSDTHVTLKGTALPSGGRRVTKVQITADGSNWMDVHLAGCENANNWAHSWAMVSWEYSFPRSALPDPDADGNVTFKCRAVDEGYSTQPSEISQVWNMRGYLINSYDETTVRVPGHTSSAVTETSTPEPAVQRNSARRTTTTTTTTTASP